MTALNAKPPVGRPDPILPGTKLAWIVEASPCDIVTVKVSEWAKTHGPPRPGMMIVHSRDLRPHGERGDVRIVSYRASGGPEEDGVLPDYFLLPECRVGQDCFCRDSGYPLSDEWFDVVLERPVSDEEAARARLIPDVSVVADDLRRMFSLRRRP